MRIIKRVANWFKVKTECHTELDWRLVSAREEAVKKIEIQKAKLHLLYGGF